eukprot:5841507-Pyramimonas_sp.AAC.1
MPCHNRAEYIVGATLEHLSTVIRDDIILWAFSFGNYKGWFKQNDAAVGQDCILLSEAGGDTRCDMAHLRDQRTQAQENRVAAFLAS